MDQSPEASVVLIVDVTCMVSITHQSTYATVGECVVLYMPPLKQDTAVVLLDQQSIPAGIRMCSNVLLQNVDLKRAIHFFIN